ncbi:MAG TPA: hypothetical protein VIC61_09820 [Gammaproteobacteria bacterium]
MSADDDSTKTQDTTRTTAKTLWTETVLEILYETLRKNKDDAQLRNVLKEVQAKGFRRDQIIEKVGRKVDAQAASRVRKLLNQ